MVTDEILELKRRYEEELLSRAAIRGVGVGLKVIGGKVTDEVCLTLLVTKKIQPRDLREKDMVPAEIGGVRTDVIEVGVVRVPPITIGGRRDRLRPAPGGCSVGHVRTTAGTLGCVVRKRNGPSILGGEEKFFLSANHVIAAANFGVRGDIVLQPGPADGGQVPQDELAELADYVPLDFAGVNQMDAAIARPLSPELVTPEIIEIGVPTGTEPVELGMTVVKSGRTTGLTRGAVGVVATTIDVMYGERRVRFIDQCVVAVPGFSRGGDSGAAVLTEGRKVFGLLFAGSEEATVFTPISGILSAFDALILT